MERGQPFGSCIIWAGQIPKWCHAHHIDMSWDSGTSDYFCSLMTYKEELSSSSYVPLGLLDGLSHSYSVTL